MCPRDRADKGETEGFRVVRIQAVALGKTMGKTFRQMWGVVSAMEKPWENIGPNVEISAMEKPMGFKYVGKCRNESWKTPWISMNMGP